MLDVFCPTCRLTVGLGNMGEPAGSVSFDVTDGNGDGANRNCPELLTETAHPERSPE